MLELQMVIMRKKASFDQIYHYGNPCLLVDSNMGAQKNSCKSKKSM